MDREPPPAGRPVRRVLAVVAALLVTACVCVPSIRSFTPPPVGRDGRAVAADALPRLAFLRAELDSGAGERMQLLFPEGYAFLHALYGLSRVNTAVLDPGQRAASLEEARWALERLESPAGTAPFPAEAAPAYGVYHAGWSAWLRGRVVELAGGPAAAPEEAAALARDAAELDAAFTDALRSGTPYLTAYPGLAWPVDSVVGAAVLRLSDRVHGTSDHTATLDRWSDAVRDRLDPATGLIPHSVDPLTGAPLEGARGSSQALLLRFLAEVDPEWAAADYAVFLDRFGSTAAPLPGIREHPRGDDSPGDVDSGPLVFGLSASASTVALGDAVLFGDAAAAAALTGFAEATGTAVETGGQRRYLGGMLPVGDAFLVWSLTASGEHAAPGPVATDRLARWWRVPWFAGVAVVLAAAWWPAARAFRRRPRPSPAAPGPSSPGTPGSSPPGAATG
ncbi:hypothetical protein [Nocardiopsis trehalosi]|uniref:hypothetical protein n=1 Tax=Nocardiopsis trehalosi TaxID=109329 RepID=UPI000AE16D77|nr:hypothetical protein [Nocardiopsis trehalosi]